MPVRKEDSEMTRYLLGEMASGERSAFEDRFFGDDKLYERLVAVEGDLLDEYARGRLTPAERAKLEVTLLATPGGRERLAFAHALAERSPVLGLEGRRESLWRSLAAWLVGHRSIAVAGLVAAVLAVVAGVSWIAFEKESKAPPPERAGAPASQPDSPPDQPEQVEPPVPAALPSPPAPPPPSRSVVAFAFAAQTSRGVEQLRTLRVPATAETVRFQLELEPDEHPRYTAVLRTADGREVLRRSGVGSRRAGAVERVTLDVPAARLADDEYVLSLDGPGDAGVVADYLFRVVRK